MRPHERQQTDMYGSAQLEASIACTYIHEGRVVACGGVLPYLNGTADIWLIPSVYLSEYKRPFIKNLRKWLFGVRENLVLNRMQSYCLDDDLHNAWMKFLGFEKEGTLKKYHHGVDYNIWGKTWELKQPC